MISGKALLFRHLTALVADAGAGETIGGWKGAKVVTEPYPHSSRAQSWSRRSTAQSG